MQDLFQPDQTAGSIYDIELEDLWNRGYHNIILDIDNTITPWNQYHINPQLDRWLRRAEKTGFRICLLSNSQQQKVQQFALELGVIAAPCRGKPCVRAFQSALAALNCRSCDTLVIGDQILTDILGGNRTGLYTILVDPMDPREFIGTKFNRWIERLLVGRKSKCKSHRISK